MSKYKKDPLGQRIKDFYESRTQTKLPRRAYTIMRLDGKAFHTYTKGLPRPFDLALTEDMDAAAQFLCENIQGAKFAYVQSDEISILITDFAQIATTSWFDGNVQKMTSISASMCTAKFNEVRRTRFVDQKDGFMRPPMLAMFDSRVFTIPASIEVENYFIWRQQDATRNSISSAAQSMFSPTELHKKSTNEMQEMMFSLRETNWNDYDPKFKRGRMIVKEQYQIPTNNNEESNFATRNRWVSVAPPILTEEREWLRERIPNITD